MDHAQRLAAKEAADRADIVGRLAALIARTPATHAQWSYQRVAAYKAVMFKAQALINKPKAALRSLRTTYSELNSFHQGK